MTGPACADRLDLVDATIDADTVDRNAAARELAILCRHCPVAEQCLALAVASREYGVWAGTLRSRGADRAHPTGRLKVVAA